MADILETGEALAPLFAKIAIISSKIGAIHKDKKHAQGYDYHSADAIMGALNELMAQHGLVVIPTTKTVGIEEGRYVISYRFMLCDAETGMVFSADWLGEAPLGIARKDGSIAPDDKAMGKAHTYAYKYWLMKLFMISTVDTDDLDTNHQESTPASKPAAKSQAKQAPKDHTQILDAKWDKPEMEKFWRHCTETMGIAGDTVLRGLGVTKLSEWQGSYDAAKARMDEYIK
jgi:hypothetical protein